MPIATTIELHETQRELRIAIRFITYFEHSSAINEEKEPCTFK